jgi:hypothetical protein
MYFSSRGPAQHSWSPGLNLQHCKYDIIKNLKQPKSVDKTQRN